MRVIIGCMMKVKCESMVHERCVSATEQTIIHNEMVASPFSMDDKTVAYGLHLKLRQAANGPRNLSIATWA